MSKLTAEAAAEAEYCHDWSYYIFCSYLSLHRQAIRKCATSAFAPQRLRSSGRTGPAAAAAAAGLAARAAPSPPPRSCSCCRNRRCSRCRHCPATAAQRLSRSRGNRRKPGTATATLLKLSPPVWPTRRKYLRAPRTENPGGRAASSASAPRGCTHRTREMPRGPRAWPPPSRPSCWTSLTISTTAPRSSSHRSPAVLCRRPRGRSRRCRSRRCFRCRPRPLRPHRALPLRSMLRLTKSHLPCQRCAPPPMHSSPDMSAALQALILG